MFRPSPRECLATYLTRMFLPPETTPLPPIMPPMKPPGPDCHPPYRNLMPPLTLPADSGRALRDPYFWVLGSPPRWRTFAVKIGGANAESNDRGGLAQKTHPALLSAEI